MGPAEIQTLYLCPGTTVASPTSVGIWAAKSRASVAPPLVSTVPRQMTSAAVGRPLVEVHRHRDLERRRPVRADEVRVPHLDGDAADHGLVRGGRNGDRARAGAGLAEGPARLGEVSAGERARAAHADVAVAQRDPAQSGTAPGVQVTSPLVVQEQVSSQATTRPSQMQGRSVRAPYWRCRSASVKPCSEVASEGPGGPCGPVGPVGPVGPMGPAAPVAPVAPVAPGGPLQA
jgi:hypothetical protein